MPRAAWEAARAAYLGRVRPWAEDRSRRMSRGQKHPVHDFLFEYYSFRPAHLMRWTPGMNVVLEGAAVEDIGWADFKPCDVGLVLRWPIFNGPTMARKMMPLSPRSTRLISGEYEPSTVGYLPCIAR